MKDRFHMLTLDNFIRYLRTSDDSMREEFSEVITDLDRFENLLTRLERRTFKAVLEKGRND